MNQNEFSCRKRPRCVEPETALSMLQRQRADASSALSSGVFTAASLLQHPQWRLLPGTITEIAGPAGAGKTQLALTMCADSVLLGQKAVYVSLGGPSNGLGRVSHRLEAMLSARINSKLSLKGPQTMRVDDQLRSVNANPDETDQVAKKKSRPENVRQYLRNVYLHWVRNSEELMALLQNQLPNLLESGTPKSVRLIVLDGIANIFRHADQETMYATMPTRQHWHDRTISFFQISTICKRLSNQFQAPFVILNQATACIANENEVDPTVPPSEESLLEPALGLSWKQCVNVSLFVTGTQTVAKSSCVGHQPRIRRLRCLKSPGLPEGTAASFYIDQRGTVRLDDIDSQT